MPEAHEGRREGERVREMRVAVIGGGIQGIGIALELTSRGVRVDLHEKTDRAHGRASLANEGKIHLGYIYAHDPSLRTARQMVEGAWSFSGILADWLERPLDDRHLSAPFRYLVHRASLLDAGTLEGMYRRIADVNAEMAEREGASYFRTEGARPPRLLDAAGTARRYGPDIVAAFDTPELAVDTEAIGEALRRRVSEDPLITLRLGSEVLAAAPGESRVALTSRQDGSRETTDYDHVINASWDDLLHIDRTAGIAAPPGSSFRLRRILRVRAQDGGESIGSSSIVLGAFGDVVRFGGGDVFLSWYPVGRRAMLSVERPPAAWWDPPPNDEVAEIRTRTFAALQDLVPALGSVETSAASATVHTGVIYARGATDIDDPGSGYHERHAIGPRSFGRYHSIDTGKYTTAPLFARRLADAIAGPRPRVHAPLADLAGAGRVARADERGEAARSGG